jgi:hypothetical protein
MSYNNDWSKMILAEMKPGINLNSLDWSQIPQSFSITAANKLLYFADEADTVVVNGTMEAWASATDLNTWTEQKAGTSTVNREGTTVHRGTYAARLDIDASNNYAMLLQGITLTASGAYQLSLWYKTAAGKTAAVHLFNSTSNVRLNSAGAWVAYDNLGIVLPTATVWTQYTLQFTAHASYTSYYLQIGHNIALGSTAASTSIYMDDVFICPRLIATLTENTYTLAGLLAEIKTAMEIPGAGTYTITESAGIITIASVALSYLFKTTTTNALWATIGFSTAADSNFASSHDGTTDIVTNAYSATLDFREIIEMRANGVSLTKVASAALAQATASSFYQDFWGKTIYVHMTDGSDPGAYISGPVYTNSIIAIFLLCFANAQFTGSDCLDFIPEDGTYPVFYEPWLNEGSIESLSASVADHYSSAMEVQFGSLSLINNGWWYAYRHTYLWNNKSIKIKVGTKGDAYADYETIFVGKTRGPRITDESATFDLVDTRVGALSSLPTTRYNLTDYPSMDTEAVDRPVPILFGQVENITPVCIDTSTFNYKVSQTIFGGVTYALQSIDAVYKAGVALILNTDYTVDLTNGEFTLLASPGTAEITCDAKGIKDGFTMATGAKDGTYSENVADHLFFILHVLNEAPVAQIDLTSFDELKTARTQKVVLYLDTDTPTMDVNRLFQQSTIYHFLPLLNGTFAARYYRRTVPVGTLELQYYDYDGFSMFDQPENVYRDVVIKFDKDPTTGVFKTVSASTSEVNWNYDEKQQIEIETALRDVSEAEAVRAFYVTLLNAPSDKLETSISLVGRNLLPTDKLILSRTIETESGSQTLLAEEVYVILETRKDLASGKVGVVAQRDDQLAIYAVHADSEHQDSHADHSDTLHSDAAHADSHSDSHTDTHTDTHSDVLHVDRAYNDYLDSDHYTDHVHLDVPHSDSHGDTHGDTHADVAHVDASHADYTDLTHLDSHSDISHIDSEV